MGSSTNLWMCLAGLVYLIAGVFLARGELAATRGWEKLIALGTVFVAASLAAFAPEHFRGPQYVQDVVPVWMPARPFWPRFVGCALLAAATSLTLNKFVRLSSTLLAIMFSLFVATIYLPGLLAQLNDRFAWTLLLRDLSFAGGAWALAGLHTRPTSPRTAEWMIAFGRSVFAVAAIFFAAQQCLHARFAPGIPLEKLTPVWVPVPSAWGYLAGAILLTAGISLVINRGSRLAAIAIGAFMTVLTLGLYLPALILAYRGGAVLEINESINYVADTLLYAGAALLLARVSD